MNKQTEATNLQAWWFATGNIANNLIFMLITMFMMYYFTNVMGLDSVVAGTIFMVARLVDAFTDPLMGMIIDRTNSKRFGKYRGFIHFGAPLLGVIVVALFTLPNLSMGGRILYAYVVYIMYSLAWTIVQVPQLTIPIIMSNNIATRTKYQAIFQGVGAIGASFTSALAMAIVGGNQNMTNPEAWSRVGIVFAVLATIGFELSTLAVRHLDVYDPDAKEKAAKKAAEQKEAKLPLKERISFLTKNVALFALLISFGTDMFANQINTQTNTYFYMYNMDGNTDLMSTLQALSLPISIAMIFLAGPMVKKFSKKNIIIGCEVAGIIAALVIWVTQAKNIPIFMAASIVGTITFAICNLMCRTALLDVASWTRWKTGVNASGLMASTFTFMNKFMQAIASYIGGYMLKVIAFDASLPQQTPEMMGKLLAMRAIFPIIAYICTIAAMHFYPIDKKGEEQLQVALNEMDRQEG